MRTRILWNDLKGSPLLAVTTWLFMAVSVFMFALTCFLAIGSLGSVDTLMEAALVQFTEKQEHVPCGTAPHGYPTGTVALFPKNSIMVV